jgi:predicted enzyme related to lactoylglutathione lyase
LNKIKQQIGMNTKLGRVVVLVSDYDEAFAFYEKNFFCKKLHDETVENGLRFLHIAFSEDEKEGIWFMKADSEEQKLRIGTQTAGQPTLVIYTDHCEDIYQHVQKNGVPIIEKLQATQGSKFFHCLDLYGNRLTVVELG